MEAAARLDAKRAFEAADDAMDYLLDLDKETAVAAIKAARNAATVDEAGLYEAEE